MQLKLLMLLLQVTADGLSSLLPLTGLRELSLEGCLGVNDGNPLQTCQRSRHIRHRALHVSQAALEAVLWRRACALSHDDCADALKTISQLHGLTNLNIASCEDVMDEGLQALAGLSDLDSLVAVDCRLTDEGVASLQKVG